MNKKNFNKIDRLIKTRTNVARVAFNTKRYCNRKSLAECDTSNCILRAESDNTECMNYLVRRIYDKLCNLIGEEL